MNEFEQNYEKILSHFVKSACVKTILELGVCTGVSTRAFLEALNDDGYLWSVDNHPCEPHVSKIKEEYPKWVFFHSEDLQLVWNRKVDLIFIDTVHTYEQTLAELDKFTPFARHWIFLHDTKSNPPVKDAIETFLRFTEETWFWSSWMHHHGLTLLMRGEELK